MFPLQHCITQAILCLLYSIACLRLYCVIFFVLSSDFNTCLVVKFDNFNTCLVVKFDNFNTCLVVKFDSPLLTYRN